MSENTTKGDDYNNQAGIVPDCGTEESRSLTCEQCNKCFKSKANLRQHKRIHTDERPHKCSYCFRCFRHKGHLNEHMRIHTGEKPFRCNLCEKRFNRKGLLHQHLKTHREDKRSDLIHAEQLLSDKEGGQAFTTVSQSATTDERDKLSESIQGNEGSQGLVWNGEAAATNIVGEPCREAIVELPSSVQTVTMPCNSTTADTCESQAGSVDERERSGLQPFKCNKRGKHFSQKEGSHNHEGTPALEKRFECNQCGKCFRHKGNLNQHKISHSGVKAFKCNYCNRCFGHKGHLNEHQRIHTGERPFKCDQCNRSFSRAGILQQHKLTHTGEKPYNCTECGRRFNRLGLLNQHVKAHVAEKRAGTVLLPGTMQSQTMAENYDLTENVSQRQAGSIDQPERTGEFVLKSGKTSNKSCTQEDQHEKTQEDQNERTREEKLFQCDHCGKCFSHKWNLDKHSKTHTEEKRFGCNQCDKSFARKGNLNQHKRIHTDEKSFICNYCFKGFSHKGHLNEHKRIHTGEKPFRCDQCEKRFTRNSLLKQHERTHARKNRVTICGSIQPALACGKSGDTCEGQSGNVGKEVKDENTCSSKLIECSEQKENLSQHEITVTEETSFKCNQCDMSFSLKENLDKHLITHDKTLKCNYCNKLFKHKGHLNEHKRIHTGEKPFKCTLCEKRFNRRALVKQHHRTHLKQKQRGIALVPSVIPPNIVPMNSELRSAQGGNVNEQEATREQPRCKSLVQKDADPRERSHTQKKKEKVFQCNYCSKRFDHKGHLNEHRRIHTGEKPYSCALCEKRFHRKSILSQHLKVHRKTDSVKYTQSDQSSGNHGNEMVATDTHTEQQFVNESHFNTLRNKNEKYLNGEQSGWSNPQSGLILETSPQQHKVNTFSDCKLRDKGEIQEEILEKKAKRVDATENSSREAIVDLPSTVQTLTLGDSSLNDDLCEAQAGNENEHERSVERLVKFTKCDKSFVLKDDPENLRRTRTEDERFGCTENLQANVTDKCVADRSLRSAVQSRVVAVAVGELHQMQTRRVEQRERTIELIALKFNDCNESSTQEQNQGQMEGKSTGENSFRCESCNTCFNHKWQLDEHEKTHTEKRPFECDQCGKSFRHKGSLYQHRKAHTGGKSFKCNYCNKSFGHKGHLNEHIRIHTGEKPFHCNQCGKRFNRKSILKTHQKIHTAENV